MQPKDPAQITMHGNSGKELGIPEEYRTGDILHVRIDALETPFGDMQLNMGVRVSMNDQRNESPADMPSFAPMPIMHIHAKTMQLQA
jgi:hypothetical protein